jgi:hypothetical protein
MTDEMNEQISSRLRRLTLIDAASSAAKRAAHACANPLAKEHLEYALALIGESWIAESGQNARKPQAVVADVASSLRLFEMVCSGKGGN